MRQMAYLANSRIPAVTSPRQVNWRGRSGRFYALTPERLDSFVLTTTGLYMGRSDKHRTPGVRFVQGDSDSVEQIQAAIGDSDVVMNALNMATAPTGATSSASLANGATITPICSSYRRTRRGNAGATLVVSSGSRCPTVRSTISGVREPIRPGQ